MPRELQVYCLGPGQTHNNTNKQKQTFLPGLCGDNFLNSREASSEMSFWPITWQVLTTVNEEKLRHSAQETECNKHNQSRSTDLLRLVQ